MVWGYMATSSSRNRMYSDSEAEQCSPWML
jgi:hypothetical protein